MTSNSKLSTFDLAASAGAPGERPYQVVRRGVPGHRLPGWLALDHLAGEAVRAATWAEAMAQANRWRTIDLRRDKWGMAPRWSFIFRKGNVR